MIIHREWHNLVGAQLSSTPRPPPCTKPSCPSQHVYLLMYSPLYYSSSSLLPRASVTAGSPSELKSAGDSSDWGPGDLRTQLSASGHCTDRSAAEAQHWRWPGRGPVTSIPSLRHFSALIRLQVLSPPNIVSLISPLLSSAKCLTFASSLTSSFTWMQCNFGLKN